MRVLIALTSDVIGPRSLIVEDATQADVDGWLQAARDAPSTALDFARARIHLTAGTIGRGSCRAGDITSIRPI